MPDPAMLKLYPYADYVQLNDYVQLGQVPTSAILEPMPRFRTAAPVPQTRQVYLRGLGSSMPGPYYYARGRDGTQVPYGDYMWKPVAGFGQAANGYAGSSVAAVFALGLLLGWSASSIVERKYLPG